MIRDKFCNWTDEGMIYALKILLDNSFARCYNKVFRQMFGIPIRTNSTHLIAVLFIFCHESPFMANLHKVPYKHPLIRLFNNNCAYLDAVLTVNNLKHRFQNSLLL